MTTLANARDPLIFGAGAFQRAFYTLMAHGTANQVRFVLSRVTRGLSTRWSQLPPTDARQKRSRSSRGARARPRRAARDPEGEMTADATDEELDQRERILVAEIQAGKRDTKREEARAELEWLSMRKLTKAILKASEESERASNRLAYATYALVVVTGLLVGATVYLAWNAPNIHVHVRDSAGGAELGSP